jgi:Family of unknown function (DUF5681)
MTFKPGQSGNPAGRAVGSRNKKTLAAEAALFEHAQELVHDLVARAKRGEPAAMRLAMDRILPTGRGRPLPIELPPVRSTEDAQVAAGVIMDALKEGALSAREAVDLINVVGALTRLNGAIELIKKMARREVARAAQTLGFEHFLASRPGLHDYERRAPEMDAEEEVDLEEDELPRHPDEYPPDMPEGDESLQIVADSEVTASLPPTGVPATQASRGAPSDPSPPLPPAFAGIAGGGEPRGL